MRPSPEAERLAATLFTREECDGLSASADRDLAFLRCWTRKEAVLKAVGRGLSIETAAFNTGATPGTRFPEVQIGHR
jgi:4'-phosphopantetheinyl transferase